MALDLILTEVQSELPMKLAEVWPTIEKARAELGIVQTTVEIDLGNLQYSGETPITWISQCASQAEAKANALHDAYWSVQELKLKIKNVSEKTDEKSVLKAKKLQSQIQNNEHYIKTCYQDLIHYQQTAKLIREKFNISEDLTAEDLAENSKREHIRKAMRQALRDIENSGVISKGVSEHLEHYGIHPMTARLQVQEYRKSVTDLFEQNLVPTMEHLLNWLDEMERVHYKGVDDMLKYMRLKDNN